MRMCGPVLCSIRHTCTHTRTHAHTHARAHTHTHTHMHTHTHTHACAHAHTHRCTQTLFHMTLVYCTSASAIFIIACFPSPHSNKGRGTCSCNGTCACDVSLVSNKPYTGDVCECSPDTDRCINPADISQVCVRACVRVYGCVCVAMYNRHVFVCASARVSIGMPPTSHSTTTSHCCSPGA